MPEQEKINLEKLIKIHNAAGVLYSRPSSWDIFAKDVPQSLIEAMKKFTEAKEQLEKEMLKIGAIPNSTLL